VKPRGEGVRKPHVVALALAELGGAGRWIDTEDIAVRARELAPEAFSWRKYPEQIDLDGVRVALHDAGKPRYGSLVEGSVKTGWSLTLAGVEWAKEHGASIRRALTGRARPARRDELRVETRKRALERGRIKRLVAWRLWEAGLAVEPHQAEAVFRVDSETPRRDVHLKVQRMIDLLADDPTVGSFVRDMAELVSGPPGGACRRPRRRRSQEG